MAERVVPVGKVVEAGLLPAEPGQVARPAERAGVPAELTAAQLASRRPGAVERLPAARAAGAGRAAVPSAVLGAVLAPALAAGLGPAVAVGQPPAAEQAAPEPVVEQPAQLAESTAASAAQAVVELPVFARLVAEAVEAGPAR